MITDYFDEIEKLLSSFPYIISINTSFEIIDADRGYFRIKLTLIDKSEIYLFEYAEFHESRATVIKYRYHWQDKGGKLILRWDNAKHHPEIQTFPDHLHEKEEQNVKPSAKPDIKSVLLKVAELIESKRA